MASTKTRTKADADTTSAPTQTAPEEPTAATAAEETRASGIGQLVDLHPAQLVRDPANVRKNNAEPTADLLASVAEVGVQTPIGVRLLPDGTYGVFMGQRRMLAAQAAAEAAKAKGEPVRLVPAIVHEITDGDDVEAVLLSLIENEHRAEMTEADKVNAVAQLSLLTDGSSARRRRAARALGLSADEVAAAARAKELKQETLSYAAGAQMSLLDMADLVEVEGMPQAMRELAEAKKRDAAEGRGGRGHWQHAMSRLRQKRELEARIEATRAELTAAQVPEVRAVYWSGYGEKPKQLDLSELRTELGNPLTAEAHAACPGHAARIDTETGEAVYVCRDPKAYGHKLPSKPPANKRTPEEQAKHARTVSHNRAWKAARPVRHQFITELVAGAKVSEAVQLFCLANLLHSGPGSYHYANKREFGYVAAFLGAAKPTFVGARSEAFMPQISKAMKGRRSANLLLAHIAAVIELDMGDRAWDSPQSHVREWLRLLAAEGYTLSEIEAEITGPLTTATDQEQTATEHPAADQPTPGNGDDQGDEGSMDGDDGEAEAAALAA